jgi:hypothetical protein
MLHLILSTAVLVAGFLTVGLAVVIIGIHRSEHGKRLTARPDGLSERSPAGCSSARAAVTHATTRREATDEQDDRPFRRRGHSRRPALRSARLPQVPRPVPLVATPSMACP